MELEQNRESFRKQGLGVAAVSYDSAALLRQFAERKGIHYPLLSDPQSKVIRAFGILNDNFTPGQPWYGVPFPGTFITDEQGVVRAKFFEGDHGERYTAANILVREFHDESGLLWNEVETRHGKVRYAASDSVVRPGNRSLLLLEVELKPGMHVYAPGVQKSYIPIEWKVQDSEGWQTDPAVYPKPEELHLPAIGETVPVYQKRFRLARDIQFGQNKQLQPLLKPGKELWVEGSFRYQACDEKECYPPQTIPLKWVFLVQGHDTQRAPEELRKAP